MVCEPYSKEKPQKQAGPSDLCPVGHTWLSTAMDVGQEKKITNLLKY